MTLHHHAFISYSHAADARLAPAFEDGLERIGKPLLRLRGLDVFRDGSDLSASPGLWSGIVAHLEAAEWLLFFASPQSAASPWCGEEVAWWLTNRSVDRLLIVLTAGEIVWDKRNPKGDATGIAVQHETLLVFAKNKAALKAAGRWFSRPKPGAEAFLAKGGQIEQVGHQMQASSPTFVINPTKTPVYAHLFVRPEDETLRAKPVVKPITVPAKPAVKAEAPAVEPKPAAPKRTDVVRSFASCPLPPA